MAVLHFSFDESGESASLQKSAIIFVSGDHKDKRGVNHQFSEERVQTLVDNTNEAIESGQKLPLMLDHQKTADSVIGELTGQIYTKIITPKDLPNPKAKYLLGRLGVFTDSVLAKGKKTVQMIKDGVLSSLSAGIDPASESFIEVSCVSHPAIRGMQLYGKNGLSKTLEFSEMTLDPEMESPEGQKDPILNMYAALGIEKQATKIQEEYEKLANALGKVLTNIYTASEEALKGKNPIEESYAALDYFNQEVERLFELVEEENDSEEPELPTTVKQTDSDRRKAAFSKPNKRSYINFSQR